MKTFLQFTEEMVANTTANVQGLTTEPVVSVKAAKKYKKKNKKGFIALIRRTGV